MGPLLPLAMLFGGLWYLDKDKSEPKPQESVGRATRFSKMAVASVTEMRGEVRHFKQVDIDLSAFGLEYVPIENGSPDIAMFKLVRPDIGSVPAAKAVEDALSKQLTVLGSLSLCLAELGTETMLLLFVPAAKAKLASANSHLAVLAETAPPVEAVEAKPAKRRNGLVKTEVVETPAPPNGEKPVAEA